MTSRHFKALPCRLATLALIGAGFPGWALAWDKGHAVITARAVQLVSEEDRKLFGDELDAYASRYCFIPDWVYKNDGTERYVWEFVGEKVTDYSDPRFERLHRYMGALNAYGVLDHYIRAAIKAGREGRAHDFACYMGILSHALEDWTCPPHCTGEDNMMGLLQSYLPPPAGQENKVLHWMLETSAFTLDDANPVPRVVAATPGELAWRVLARVERDHLAARASIVPMMLDVYRGDQKACDAKQKSSGARGLALVVDVVRTICALVRGQGGWTSERPILLTDIMPCEARGLVYSQSQYFWDPYWGKPTRDCIYREGIDKFPLAVRLNGERLEVNGLGFGTQTYSWNVPKGLFRRLTAVCGLHADLADGGMALMRLAENGRVVKSFSLKGTEEAQALDLALSPDTTNLSIRVQGDRSARKTYFVFGNPELHLK